MNPFAKAAMGNPQEEAERRARAPRIVDHVSNSIGPVSQLSQPKRELAEALIAEGDIECVKRGDDFYISADDLIPYTIGDDDEK